MDTDDMVRRTSCGGAPDPARRDGVVTVLRARQARGAVRDVRRHPDRGTLLHLVAFDHPAFGTLLAFGSGTPETITGHLAGGAAVRRVLRADPGDVATAARELRARYRPDAVGPVGGMPPSFGAGRDVVPGVLGVDLRDVLTGPAVTDVTHLFGPVRTRIVVGRR